MAFDIQLRENGASPFSLALITGKLQVAWAEVSVPAASADSTVTESSTAAESSSADLLAATQIVESSAAADAVDSASLAPKALVAWAEFSIPPASSGASDSVDESSAVVDSSLSTADFQAFDSATLSVQDSTSALLSESSASTSESAAAVDSSASILSAAVAVTESSGAVVAESAVSAATTDAVESVGASEVSSHTSGSPGAVAESSAVSETSASLAAAAPALQESVSSSESQSATLATVSVSEETSSVAEAVDASISSPKLLVSWAEFSLPAPSSTQSASVSESAAVSESSSVLLVGASAALESSAASETQAAQSAATAASSETSGAAATHDGSSSGSYRLQVSWAELSTPAVTDTTPAISGLSSLTPIVGAALVVSGSLFGATQGAGGVTIGGVTQPVSTWSDSSASVVVQRGVNKYGVSLNVVVTDSDLDSSSPFALTSLTPPSGWQYVNVVTPNTTAANRITAVADISASDQLSYGNIVGTGSVTVFDDATFVADAGVVSFDVEVWNTDGWGSVATQTVAATSTASIAESAAASESSASTKQTNSASSEVSSLDATQDAIFSNDTLAFETISVSASHDGASTSTYKLQVSWAEFSTPAFVDTTPAISGVGTLTPVVGSTLVVSGSLFGATQGAGGVTIGGVTQPVSAWSDSSASVVVQRGPNKYGISLNVVVTDADLDSSSPFALTSLTPPSGWQYVNVVTPNTTAANRVTAVADISATDQLSYGNIVGTGSVTVFDDATFVADAGVISFDVEVWNTDGWGAAATQIVPVVSTASITENSAASESTSSIKQTDSSVSESSATSTTELSNAPSVASSTETLSSTESAQAGNQAVAARIESAAPTETPDAIIIPDGTASAFESLAVAAAHSATLAASRSMTEAASVIDTVLSGNATQETISELSSLVEQVSSSREVFANSLEASSAVEQILDLVSAGASVVEARSLSDSVVAIQFTGRSISESVAVADLTNSTLPQAGIVESVTAGEIADWVRDIYTGGVRVYAIPGENRTFVVVNESRVLVISRR